MELITLITFLSAAAELIVTFLVFSCIGLWSWWFQRGIKKDEEKRKKIEALKTPEQRKQERIDKKKNTKKFLGGLVSMEIKVPKEYKDKYKG